MALARRNNPGRLARRIVGFSFLADVVGSGIVAMAFNFLAGFILFIVGLFMTGVTYFNLRNVLRTKGMRW